MKEIELYEKIEAYLKNRLSPEANQAFEAEITADPLLAEEVALHRDMLEATVPADVLDLRRLMQESYKAEFGQEAIKDNSGWSFILGGRLQLAAAASVLLAVVAGVWWAQRQPVVPVAVVPPAVIDSIERIAKNPTTPDSSKNSPKNNNNVTLPVATLPDYAALVREVYTAEKPFSPSVLMGDDDDEPTETPYSKATEAYRKLQFNDVVTLLKVLPKGGTTDALKLRAHANFRLKRYDQAAADFEELTKSLTYGKDAEWYLLLCHAARLPGTKKAYEALLDKVTNPKHPFEKKATALKNKLAKQ